MKMTRLSIILLILLSLVAGCAGMSTTQKRVLGGGAIGAGAGAAAGGLTGHSVVGGAAIGAAAGAVGGYVYDESKKRQQR